MGSTRKPRKAYRPGPVYVNALASTLNRVRKLSTSDVEGHRQVIDTALRQFTAGQHCAAHWRSLADTANVAETLAGLGICSGPDADQVVQEAQEVLAAVKGRFRTRGTWTLYPAEIDALTWLNTLHMRQLQECDYAEFERALELTHNRISQARAGNAPRGAVVITGDIA